VAEAVPGIGSRYWVRGSRVAQLDLLRKEKGRIMSRSLYEIPVETIAGDSTSLAVHRGKVLLVVNVASKCGLTPQYDALERVYSRFRDEGLVVLGFPANDFGAQEPGSNEEVATFCKETFAVDFPMFSKIAVTGPATHPRYKSLIEAEPKAIGDTREGFREGLTRFLANRGETTNPEPGILWNFEKFLIGRDGNVAARFSPEVVPDDPAIVSAIETALAG
jgi:glutathione peroxidase